MKTLFLSSVFFIASMAHAMSVRIDCSAYAVGDIKLGIDKLEIRTERPTGDLSLYLNSVKAEVVSSSYECKDDLECNVIKGYPIAVIEPFQKTAITITLNKGAEKLHYIEPFRGGTIEESVYEISPVLSSTDDTVKMTGVCSSNL